MVDSIEFPCIVCMDNCIEDQEAICCYIYVKDGLILNVIILVVKSLICYQNYLFHITVLSAI